jgi:hypothetical protein
MMPLESMVEASLQFMMFLSHFFQNICFKYSPKTDLLPLQRWCLGVRLFRLAPNPALKGAHISCFDALKMRAPSEKFQGLCGRDIRQAN